MTRSGFPPMCPPRCKYCLEVTFFQDVCESCQDHINQGHVSYVDYIDSVVRLGSQ